MVTVPSATKSEISQFRNKSERIDPKPFLQQSDFAELPRPVQKNVIRDPIPKIDTFSPVNQNGSFEFDRVLKSGVVQKRTRKTKAWKSIYLVLRPHSLSIYRNQKEDKLRHKIQLSDLTAVTFLKDPKHKRDHIFGLFSPSRNFHLEANSRKDAEEWVELIRKEARIEEEEEEMLFASPGGNSTHTLGVVRAMHKQNEHNKSHDEFLGSSSPEHSDAIPRTRRTEAPGQTVPRRPSYTIDYSGNEIASHSDWSDTEMSRVPGPSSASAPEDEPYAVKPPFPSASCGARNLSQMSGFNLEQDLERVVWQGYLLCLKSKGGVRQWKDWWVVIRPKNITFYKNDSEYSPTLIISLPSIVNAVEIDPISKTRRLCIQIITEERSYKFCAHSEDDLDKSLGAIKSLLARRRESRAT